jgi:hypothetical protein
MRPYFERDGIVIYLGRWEEVLPTLAVRPSLLLTDPPYGIAHDTDYTRFTGGVAASFSSHAAIAGDATPFDPTPLLTLAPRVILWGANCYSDRLPQGSWLVWDKRAPGGAKNVMSDAEVAWFNQGHGVYCFSHTWDGFNRASERGTAYHPTQKPVALMRWVLSRWSQPGDLVLDTYAGSGPIAKAAMELGRQYVGIELEERYCEIAARRLSQMVLPLGGA